MKMQKLCGLTLVLALLVMSSGTSAATPFNASVHRLAANRTTYPGIRSSVAAQEIPIRIDFDTELNRTMNNYLGFQPLVYDSARGYGWSDTVGSYYSGSYSFKYLTNDMHYSSNDGTFLIDIPNGEYTVKLYFRGSIYGTYMDDFQVISEGVLVLDEIDSTPYPNIKSFDTVVSDGQLNLTFHDNGGEDDRWMVNGVEVYDKIARPQINGLSDANLTTGESITITGLHFGVKDSASPLKWDDFESGSDGHDIGALSDWASWGIGINAPKYTSGSPNRPGSNLCSEHKMGPGDYSLRNSRIKWWTNENTDKLYVSFWTRFNFGRNIVDDDNSYQLKFWRLSETETSDWNGNLCIGTSNWKHDVGEPTEYANHYYWVRTGGDVGFGGGDYYSPPLEEDVWFRIEMQVKQSDMNVPNGGFSVWHSMSSGPIINVASNWDALTREVPEKLKAISLGEWLGNLTDGETEMYYDDVYFDNSWARVEIGDNQDFDSCTHREIQIPTAWSESSIAFTVNQGAYSNGDTAYLFVVDAEGNPSNGYPITLTQMEPPALVLNGAPAGQAIHLTWTVNATLPVTSTWQLAYDGPSGDQSSPITGIISPTRAYTLTGLTNYTWYIVTLNGMLDSTAFLTDTVTVMPTDIFVYLPLVLRDK